MINPDQLQTGNYVYLLGFDWNHDNKFPDPEGNEIIILDESILEMVKADPDAYEGIPLTPLLMRRIGFIEIGANLIRRNRVTMRELKNFQDESKYIYEIGIQYRDGSQKLCMLDYVHELQNLFAKELNEEIIIYFT